MRIIRKILSGKFLDINLFSQKYQLVHIRIVNLVGTSKLSVWEEIYKGENSLAIDVSGLIKGPYKIIIDFPEENSREEIFTIQ
ncbi:MAG TPA: hypothetical protein VK766_05985 [Cytophagaceae bacterium]|jgi:hypothetical protein|nr:hypothetical protein [Cytophagaceae bacterium]